VQVEIYSDVVCPWCAVGKRRLELALGQFEHADEIDVIWRAYELDPDAPPLREGDYAERLARKYGMSREQAVAANERMTAMAAAEGLDFRFEEARPGNTFDAHRLLHYARVSGSGLQDALKERFFLAYFTEGQPIGDPETLERLAVEVGLPADEVRELLAGERYAAEVRDDERTAASFGISGVPFFVVDRSLAASGAQSPEILGQLLSRGWSAAAGTPETAGSPAAAQS
jgi:predicted DsbA family dithiol-disulfide isomerase